MLISDDRLTKLLLENQLVSQKQLKGARELVAQEKISLYEAVLQQELIANHQLGRLVADFLKLPFVKLSDVSIPEEVLKLIPEVVAKKQQIIAFGKDKQGLHLAMADPSNLQVREFTEKKIGLPVIVHLATQRDVNDALSWYTKDVKKAFDKIIAESIKKARGATEAEPPIIKIVDTIISYAYQNKASDAHIEPLEEASLVRFRIDGILHDIVKLPLELHPRIVTHIKVLSRLRTDEHQAAQDGKIRWSISKPQGEKLDIRVSIVPITEGEKVVMRLLSERSRQLSLVDLGLSKKDLEKVKAASSKPYGMILASGPTGSGKTTTLYAILKPLNKRYVNIMTIEDPVEYDIEGINQIQVNPKTGLSFAKGLRSIVRQDPDIILVGEIRDDETAGIAINSAMTGHLVLSTLHTNDAATAFPRLLDLKVEPFLVASTVNLIVAQRLVRQICQKCRASVEIDSAMVIPGLSPDLIKKCFGEGNSIRVYRGKGCNACHHTGYRGRIGVFEALVVDDEIRQAIVERKDATTIGSIAVKHGMVPMVEDGLEKVKQGITTIEEVIRVTKE